MASPLAREAALDVAPGELGDDAVVDRMRHRVRLRRIGRAWLRGDVSPSASPANDGAPGDADGTTEPAAAVQGAAHPELESCAAGRHRR